MLRCYLLVNTLQMYTLNSTYSPINRRIPDKLVPCLNFFLEMYRIYWPIFSLCLHVILQAFNSRYFLKFRLLYSTSPRSCLNLWELNFFVVTYSFAKICQNLQYLITVNFATAIPLACPLDLKINSAYHIMGLLQTVNCKRQFNISIPNQVFSPPFS